jgi:putative ABC transport system permease protein
MLKDLQHAWRIHRRNPLFVVVVLSSIALSIGANTLIVSILYALFLRPMPFLGDLDRLVLLSEQAGRGPWMAVSTREFRDWQDQQTVFINIAAFRNHEINLAGDGEPERVKASSGSGDLFSVLGVHPLLGRDFVPSEFGPGQNRVVIISHALWTRRFGAEAGAIGRTLRVDGEPHVLVGVTPPGFTFPDQKTHLWTPLVLGAGRNDAAVRDLQVIARLRDGVTIDQVRAEMTAIAGALAGEYPETNRDVRCVVRPLRDEMVGNARPSLVVLTCAVVFLFLVACINVATLQYARNESRRAEIATRAALGATRGRLLRQFLTESVLLALIGGLLGVGLAHLGIDVLLASVHLDIPSYFRLAIDNNVLLFATAASVLTGLAFGIAPVMSLSRPTFLGALKDAGHTATAGRRVRRIYSGCAVVEVTLAFGLLAGSATAFKSLRLLQSVDPGFQIDQRIAAGLALPESQYPELSDRRRFFDELVTRLGALAHVHDAALISRLPAGGPAEVRSFEIQDAGTSRTHSALYYACSSRLF